MAKARGAKLCGLAKGGIDYNDIQTTVAAALPAPVVTRPDANPLAFVGVVQMTATYWFNPWDSGDFST